MWVLILAFILIMIVCDANYFIRTSFTILSTRLFVSKKCITDTSTMYGIGTCQDCDIGFGFVRLSRLVRELDFARYKFYICTGIYKRSQELRIHALQGSTLTITWEPVPLFKFYKINTKLAYWDDRSLFFEHEVVTVGDSKVRSFLVSRQHVIGENDDSTEVLLRGLTGSEARPECPHYIQSWLKSMQISSTKLRNIEQK